MKKRFIAMGLALTLAATLTACGNKDKTDSTADSSSVAEAGPQFDENSVYYTYDEATKSVFQIKNGKWTAMSETTGTIHNGVLNSGVLECTDDNANDVTYEIGETAIKLTFDGKTVELPFIAESDYSTKAQLVNNNIKNSGEGTSEPDESKADEPTSEPDDSSKDSAGSGNPEEFTDVNQRPDGYLNPVNTILKSYRDPSKWDKYDPSMDNDPTSMFPMGDPHMIWALMTVNTTWQGVDESYTYADYAAGNQAKSIDSELQFILKANETTYDYDDTDAAAVLEAYEIEYTLYLNGKYYFGTVPAKYLSSPASDKYDYAIRTSDGAKIVWTAYENPIYMFGPSAGSTHVIALHVEDGDYVADRFLAEYF